MFPVPVNFGSGKGFCFTVVIGLYTAEDQYIFMINNLSWQIMYF